MSMDDMKLFILQSYNVEDMNLGFFSGITKM